MRDYKIDISISAARTAYKWVMPMFEQAPPKSKKRTELNCIKMELERIMNILNEIQ